MNLMYKCIGLRWGPRRVWNNLRGVGNGVRTRLLRIEMGLDRRVLVLRMGNRTIQTKKYQYFTICEFCQRVAYASIEWEIREWTFTQ